MSARGTALTRRPEPPVAGSCLSVNRTFSLVAGLGITLSYDVYVFNGQEPGVSC